jgi:hypothetical protein
MSSQKHIQNPKKWRSALDSNFFTTAVWLAGLLSIFSLAMKPTGVKWALFLVSASASLMFFLSRLDSVEAQAKRTEEVKHLPSLQPDDRMVIDADELEEARSDPRVKELLAWADEYGKEIERRKKRSQFEALLELMLDEPAIAKAKSAYAATKPAADDPWDDTGWDEPWGAAIEAAFNYALEDLFERE